MHYGRIQNKMKLDQADIQFAGQCQTVLGKADAIFLQAAAAAQSAEQLGTQWPHLAIIHLCCNTSQACHKLPW